MKYSRNILKREITEIEHVDELTFCHVITCKTFKRVFMKIEGNSFIRNTLFGAAFLYLYSANSLKYFFLNNNNNYNRTYTLSIQICILIIIFSLLQSYRSIICNFIINSYWPILAVYLKIVKKTLKIVASFLQYACISICPYES